MTRVRGWGHGGIENHRAGAPRCVRAPPWGHRPQTARRCWYCRVFPSRNALRGPVLARQIRAADADILSAIVVNPFIPHIYVGLRNPASHARSKRIIAKASTMASRRERIRSRQQNSWWPTFEVEYFRASSAPVWS